MTIIKEVDNPPAAPMAKMGLSGVAKNDRVMPAETKSARRAKSEAIDWTRHRGYDAKTHSVNGAPITDCQQCDRVNMACRLVGGKRLCCYCHRAANRRGANRVNVGGDIGVVARAMGWF